MPLGDSYLDKELDLRSAIPALKSSVRLLDLLRFYGVITKDGSQQIICPFHAESVASAHYYAERDSLHCFACNKSWDVLDFYKEKEHVNLKEAIHRLSTLFQLDLSKCERDAIPDNARGFYSKLDELKKQERPLSEKSQQQALHKAINKLYDYPWAAGFRTYAIRILDFYALAIANSELRFSDFKEAFRKLQKINNRLEQKHATTTH